MNDLELQTRLKNVPVPARPDEYWDDFPSRIRRQLRHRPLPDARQPVWRPPLSRLANFAFATALVLLCAIQFQAVQLAGARLNQQGRSWHVELARLDAGLHNLMLNSGGMGDLMSEAN